MHTEINEAIGAHGLWKRRLRTAAETGETSLPVDDICRNDFCKFGKWLKGLPQNAPGAAERRAVNDLHTAFHVEAGRIAGLIAAGEQAAALAALEGGTFDATSEALKLEMMKWRRAI